MLHQIIRLDVGLAALDRFLQGIVNEDVLFLRLHEKVPLGADVLEETEHVYFVLGFGLLQHRVDHDVRAGTSDTGAAERQESRHRYVRWK